MSDITADDVNACWRAALALVGAVDRNDRDAFAVVMNTNPNRNLTALFLADIAGQLAHGVARTLGGHVDLAVALERLTMTNITNPMTITETDDD